MLCAFPFSVFSFFSLTVFPSLQAVCQSQSRRCPSGQPAVIFICNYLYGVYLLKRTLLDCIRWHNRPFSAIQQFPLAQRHSRVRKRVTQDREMRERETGDATPRATSPNNQSIVTDICHVSQANFPCCSWPAPEQHRQQRHGWRSFVTSTL